MRHSTSCDSPDKSLILKDCSVIINEERCAFKANTTGAEFKAGKHGCASWCGVAGCINISTLEKSALAAFDVNKFSQHHSWCAERRCFLVRYRPPKQVLENSLFIKESYSLFCGQIVAAFLFSNVLWCNTASKWP